MSHSTTTSHAASVPAAPDPIIQAIEAYREGCRLYNDAPDTAGGQGDHLWREPWEVLARWNTPCVSRNGAMAALQLAISEDDIGESQLTAPMMRAALAYLEGTAE